MSKYDIVEVKSNFKTPKNASRQSSNTLKNLNYDLNCVDLLIFFFYSDKCDTDFDCADKSDEYYCDYLRFGENYAKELIPRDETGGALIIYMNVSVLAFPFIETIDLKFTGYFY